MGTSASVTGAGVGSPLIPTWVDDIAGTPPQGDPKSLKKTPKIEPKRLAAARRALGRFAATGDPDTMRRGVAEYVRTGRGGAAFAARRSAGSAKRAAMLSSITGGAKEHEATRSLIRAALENQSNARELLAAAIAAHASPMDGTLDSEAGRASASEALQYLLQQYPNANLLDLESEQREVLIERFLAIDSFALFYAETGKHILGKCDISTAAERITQIKKYFYSAFRQANERRKEAGGRSLGALSDHKIAAECSRIIANAYMIFEEFLDAR